MEDTRKVLRYRWEDGYPRLVVIDEIYLLCAWCPAEKVPPPRKSDAEGKAKRRKDYFFGKRESRW
jgi:hypothetical protein